jgi:hypothetical protein
MKIKKVNQYSCDFCKKKTYSAASMHRHEKHCTMNPDRECRMCNIVGCNMNNIFDLVKMMPNEIIVNEKTTNECEILTAFDKMKVEANRCPACILAVIRQLNYKNVVFDFDYKVEVEEMWKDYKLKKEI